MTSCASTKKVDTASPAMDEASSASSERFLFSIVVPMYNAQDYLAETIESVASQSIGFENAIQLILVDDESTDDTLEIARRYQAKYPHNIVVSSQTHSGTSAARKLGLSLAKGLYINFLDADDKWGTSACECALDFFKAHPEAKMCAARIKFFEAKSGDHPLSYRFGESGMIDLRVVHDFPQISLCNAFFLTEELSEGFFDDRLAYSEDFLVVNRLLLRIMQYGTLDEPAYWYRKRKNSSSTLNSSTRNKSWYLDTPRYCYIALLDEAERLHGSVPLFLQYTIMYDLQWRIKLDHPHPLTSEEYARYRTYIVSILQRIDDDVIASQRNISTHEKVYILAMKYGISFDEACDHLRVFKDWIYWIYDESTHVFLDSISHHAKVILESMSEQDGFIEYTAAVRTVFPAHRVELKLSGKKFTHVVRGTPRKDRYNASFFDDCYGEAAGFSFKIPASSVQFQVFIDGRPARTSLHCWKHLSFSFKPYGYRVLGAHVVLEKKDSTNWLVVRRADTRFVLKRELLWERSLSKGRLTPAASLALKLRRKALSQKLKKQRGDKIWLISDRIDMAGDNGEALFRYIQENPIDGVKAYFVINETSPDYERMKSIGPVVAFDSDEHKLLQLNADKVISSAAEDYVTNRFGKQAYIMHGLESFDFVFLQHGITHNDLSNWLRYPAKNIALFCTAARAERDSIVQTPTYGYSEKHVALTGFPRHDVLLNKASKSQNARKILIAPTWRKSITFDVDPKTGLREHNPRFCETDYYAFFMSLINDARLIQACKDNGFELAFLIHPSLSQEAHLFSSDYCNIVTRYNYSEELASSSILVTDYSSVAFDFALLKRPIVYAQFDYATFYANHTVDKGYFDYEQDGFGAVCYSLEDTIDTTIKMINNPVMPESYQARVDDFYGVQPDNRCQAVIDAILKMDEADFA